MPKGKQINSTAKQIIYNVYNYFQYFENESKKHKGSALPKKTSEAVKLLQSFFAILKML